MEFTTIAKPYANAIFAIAEQNQSFDDWGKMLQVGTQLARDKALQGFISSANTTKDDKRTMIVGLFESVLGKTLSREELSFVDLLLKNARINALPSICDLFAKMSNSSSDIQLFTVISAYQLSAKEQQQIVNDLSAKYNTNININTEIDENLVGGVVIKRGDKVIDLSIQARVNSLGLRLSVAH